MQPLTPEEEKERLARWLRDGEAWLPERVKMMASQYFCEALPAVSFPAGSEGRGA